MSRLDDLAGRLHPLLREGERIRSLLAPSAVAAEIAMEDMIEIGRAHRFDDVLELEEAERLGALLDIRREPWQTLPLYRAWLHATREAMRDGMVTHSAIEDFARRYAADYQKYSQTLIGPARPLLIENPRRRKIAQPDGLVLAPLAQLPIEAITPWSFAAMLLIMVAMAVPTAAFYIAAAHRARAWLSTPTVRRGADILTGCVMTAIALLLLLR